jgi:cAMP phosphodiesterase
MGAWGHGNFENDTVLDWVGDPVDTNDMDLIVEAIDMVLDEGYLDADTASIGIGAIEILAALQGRPGKEEYDDELEEWINQHKGRGIELIQNAQMALRKILAESELKELWEESDHFVDWVNTIKELESRLQI